MTTTNPLIQTIEDEVRAGTLTQADVLSALHRATGASTLYGAIEQARKDYCTDELEIDRDPLASESDEGCWVSAWVWVAYEDIGSE